jgi:hypothetical protein
MLGIEGNIGWADNKATNAGIPGTFGPGGSGPGPLAATLALDASQVKADWDASIRGRIGILASPSMLLYVTGGAAWLNVIPVPPASGRQATHPGASLRRTYYFTRPLGAASTRGAKALLG